MTTMTGPEFREARIAAGLSYRRAADHLGLAYIYRDANGRHPQYRHTRSVTGIDDLGRINRGLWDAVASLTTGNRVDLAAEMFGRLTPAERAQMAERFA